MRLNPMLVCWFTFEAVKSITHISKLVSWAK